MHAVVAVGTMTGDSLMYSALVAARDDFGAVVGTAALLLAANTTC